MSHANNLNHDAGKILNTCHCLTKRINHNYDRHELLIEVHRIHACTKYPSLQPGVVTRWGLYYREATKFNCGRHAVDEALKRFLVEDGCDQVLLKETIMMVSPNILSVMMSGRCCLDIRIHWIVSTN